MEIGLLIFYENVQNDQTFFMKLFDKDDFISFKFKVIWLSVFVEIRFKNFHATSQITYRSEGMNDHCFE